jgi:3alpha(or 20beta)-hydroxysteroid dehydrogenase
MSDPVASRRLDGKVCLITGGASGQGAAEAALFACHGAHVFITDVSVASGERVASTVGATFLEHDVSSAAGWLRVTERIVAETGRIDVLVNNAGILQQSTLTATSPEMWDRIVAVNQTGTYLGMHTVAPHMTRHRSGSIINVSSVAGLMGSLFFGYCATKWAIRGMTRSAARELGPSGVRVNSIHPGMIETPMTADMDLAPATKGVPLQRSASADEVAHLALFLASDASSYASGAEFVLDGGWSAGH